MNRRRTALSRAYENFKDRLVAILWQEDPAGMGRNVGAPEDEYEPEAALLIVKLKTAASRGDVERIVSAMFPTASVRLTERVSNEWTRFQRETARCEGANEF